VVIRPSGLACGAAERRRSSPEEPSPPDERSPPGAVIRRVACGAATDFGRRTNVRNSTIRHGTDTVFNLKNRTDSGIYLLIYNIRV